MTELGSMELKELVRVERVLPRRTEPYQDLVLVKCGLQKQPFGFARVPPGQKVMIHNIGLTLTKGEALALLTAIKLTEDEDEESPESTEGADSSGAE